MTKPTMLVHGMLGMGDCIHQRAILRELMLTHDVTLKTFYSAMYWDLIRDGLKVVIDMPQAARIREQARPPLTRALSLYAEQRRITYGPAAIKANGSILAAMYASVGLAMPVKPDFSMPVPKSWRDKAQDAIASRKAMNKPLMVYRPITLNNVWNAPSRSPDPEAYEALFASIRERYFVVSVANVGNNGEFIVGMPPDADIKLHRGELDFEGLAGLFASAALVFGNPGFTPVLAQATGTPSVVVYGGNESFRTTNSVGAHLAPTLAIQPDKPCECHDQTHKCDKRITMAAALARLQEFTVPAKSDSPAVPAEQFAENANEPRVLIFATTYVDTPEKKRLLELWITTHAALNPECDLCLVDSASPLFDVTTLPNVLPTPVLYHEFPDNIGHLARGGRDGWGRAFCKGLDIARAGPWTHVVHIEGDSLFSLDVMTIAREMVRDEHRALSVDVAGTSKPESGWAETGLMFFDVEFLRRFDFTALYDWQNRGPRPFPEQVVRRILGPNLHMVQWAAERGDRGQITLANCDRFSWITHCRLAVFETFAAKATQKLLKSEARTKPAPATVKLNFGCGTNKLPGWQNFDTEVDIAKPLPFADASADFILAEHVVEHVDYYTALKFFAECHRVLKAGGEIRIAVPSIERVAAFADDAYCNFAFKWSGRTGLRGALHAMLFAHGHMTAWTDSLLEASLLYVGFEDLAPHRPGQSDWAEFTGVEGHGKVIGEHFNDIETIVWEGTRT